MSLLTKSDHKAFNELYERYAQSLLNFFYKRFFKDEEKANDFLQDIFMKIIEDPAQFDTERKFNSWIFSIAHNMCKNEYRRKQNRGQHIAQFDLESLIDNPGFSNFISKHDINYFLESLEYALNELSLVQRRTFNLRHKEMHSLKEIAHLMDCSTGTVKSRLHNSLKELQQKLQLFKTEQ